MKYYTDFIPLLFLFVVWNEFIDLIVLHYRCQLLMKNDTKNKIIDYLNDIDVDNKDAYRKIIDNGFDMLEVIDNKIMLYSSIFAICLFSIFDLGKIVWYIFVVIYFCASFSIFSEKRYLKNFIGTVDKIILVHGGDD